MGLFSRTPKPSTDPPPVVTAIELNDAAPPTVRISNITTSEAQRLSQHNGSALLKLEPPTAKKQKSSKVDDEIAGIHNASTAGVSQRASQNDTAPAATAAAAKDHGKITIAQLWGAAAVATAVDASDQQKRISRDSQIQQALNDAAAAADFITSVATSHDGNKRSSRESLLAAAAAEPIEAVRSSRQSATSPDIEPPKRASKENPEFRFGEEAVAAVIHATPVSVPARTSKETSPSAVLVDLPPRTSSKRESGRRSGQATITEELATVRKSRGSREIQNITPRIVIPYVPVELFQPTAGDIEQERAEKLQLVGEEDTTAKNEIRRRTIDILRKCDFLCVNASNAGRHTITHLGEQTERIERMIGGLDEIGRDLGEAEAALGNLSTWCCGLFSKRNDDEILGPEDEAELNAIDALKSLRTGAGEDEDDDSDADDDIMAAAKKQQKVAGGPMGSKQLQVLDKLAKASQQHHQKHHKSHKVKIIHDNASSKTTDPLELEVCDTLMNLFIQVDHLGLETKTMNEALQAREDQINRAVGKVERNVTRLQGAIKHGQSLLE